MSLEWVKIIKDLVAGHVCDNLVPPPWEQMLQCSLSQPQEADAEHGKGPALTHTGAFVCCSRCVSCFSEPGILPFFSYFDGKRGVSLVTNSQVVPGLGNLKMVNSFSVRGYLSLSFLKLPLEPTTSKGPLTQCLLSLTFGTNILHAPCTLGPNTLFFFLPLELIMEFRFHLVDLSNDRGLICINDQVFS